MAVTLQLCSQQLQMESTAKLDMHSKMKNTEIDVQRNSS